jgi:hypothetical protein
MRKVTVELKVVLEVDLDGVDTSKVEEVLSEMDYCFKESKGAPGKITESEIIDWEIKAISHV